LLVEEARERVKGGGVDCVAGLLESVVDFVVCGRPVDVYAKGVLDLREVEVVVKGADWWDWGADGCRRFRSRSSRNRALADVRGLLGYDR
jgi:hypothetical protein